MTVNGYVPAVVGVPLIVAITGSMVRPGGRGVVGSTENTNGPLPPLVMTGLI